MQDIDMDQISSPARKVSTKRVTQSRTIPETTSIDSFAEFQQELSRITDTKHGDIDLLPNDIARSHALKMYFECINRKEYEGAITCLHRYFDFCADVTSLPSPNNDTPQQRNFLPYSILNLAVLHYHFGHFEQAIQVYI